MPQQKLHTYTRERLTRLILASLSGTIAPEDRAELERWLDADPRNRGMYAKLLDERQMNGNLKKFRGYDPADGWKKVAAAQPGKAMRRFYARVGSYAAVIAVMIVSVLWIRHSVSPYMIPTTYTVVSSEVVPGHSKATLTLGTGNKITLGQQTHDPFMLLSHGVFRDDGNRLVYLDITENNPVRWHIIEVPYGGEYRLLLADGSRVWLGPGTIMLYPTRFEGNDRRVMIVGEAYVEAADKPGNTFIVCNQEQNLHVHGGAIHFKSYTHEPLQASVISGWTEIRSGNRIAVVSEGEHITYYDGGIETRQTDIEHYADGRAERFVFDDRLIEEVLKELERWYDISIYVQNPSLKEIRYTGSLPRDIHIDSALEILSEHTGVSFQLNGRNLLVEK